MFVFGGTVALRSLPTQGTLLLAPLEPLLLRMQTNNTVGSSENVLMQSTERYFLTIGANGNCGSFIGKGSSGCRADATGFTSYQGHFACQFLCHRFSPGLSFCTVPPDEVTYRVATKVLHKN